MLEAIKDELETGQIELVPTYRGGEKFEAFPREYPRQRLVVRLLDLSGREVQSLRESAQGSMLEPYLFVGNLSGIRIPTAAGRVGIIRRSFRYTAASFLSKKGRFDQTRLAPLVWCLRLLSQAHSVGECHNNLSLFTVVAEDAEDWALVDHFPNASTSSRCLPSVRAALRSRPLRQQVDSDPFALDYFMMSRLVRKILGFGRNRRLDGATAGGWIALLGSQTVRALNECTWSWCLDSSETRVPFAACYDQLCGSSFVSGELRESALASIAASPIIGGDTALFFKTVRLAKDSCWRFTVEGRLRRSLDLYLAICNNKWRVSDYEKGLEARIAVGPDEAAVRQLEMAVSVAIRRRRGEDAVPSQNSAYLTAEQFGAVREILLREGYRDRIDSPDEGVEDLQATGLVVGVKDHETWLFPEFQFHIDDGNRSAFAAVNRMLSSRMDGWMIWSFWVSESPLARRVGADSLAQYFTLALTPGELGRVEKYAQSVVTRRK